MAIPVEIERKFLVDNKLWEEFPKPEGILYLQGYLHADTALTVRVRVAGDHGYLTVKGKTTGISRPEFEYEIPVREAEEMIRLLATGTVEKVRTRVMHAGRVWEVDEFLGENRGLMLAEIELTHEEEPFDKPGWAGEEVTGDERYYNAFLARHPYSRW